MKFIRTILSLLREKNKRFFSGISAQLFFASKGCKLRKPLHVQNVSKCIRLGTRVSIDRGARLDCYTLVEKYPKLTIGSGTMIGFGCSFLCASKIEVGKNCTFASNVFVTDENHGISDPSKPYIYQNLATSPVSIGNNCWIGEKVVILPGVTIGDSSVIGAGSVVTKSIPAYSIGVGNPCHVVKQFDKEKKAWVPVTKNVNEK
jgi:lipopolysaccharide O-acetyltransferase